MNTNEITLKCGLDSLSISKKVAFTLLLCERQLPAFQKFSTDTGFDVSRYQGFVECGWAYLNGAQSSVDFEKASKECYENAPDTEEFDHALISAALNAALSIGSLMSFLSDHNIDHIVEAAGFARDTVALNVQETESVSPHSLGFNEVMQHPLVQQELLRQEEDLKFLMSLPDNLEQVDVRLIKEHSERIEKGNRMGLRAKR